MLTRRHASLLIKTAGLQEAEHKLQLISTDAHNRACVGGMEPRLSATDHRNGTWTGKEGSTHISAAAEGGGFHSQLPWPTIRSAPRAAPLAETE